MSIYEESLKLHEANKGKIEVISKTEIKDMHDLAVVYTPGLPTCFVFSISPSPARILP